MIELERDLIASGIDTANLFGVSDNLKINIYPIPAKDQIKGSSVLEGDISILNSSGEQIYLSKFYGYSVIDTSKFPAGVYFVHIEGKFGLNTVKFIK